MDIQGPTEFAQRLRDHRESRKLTQSQFAAELGINTITLSRYERGATPVGIPWVASDLERLLKVAPPRTKAELAAQLEAWQLAHNGRGASRDVVGEASAEAGRRAPKRSKRRPPGQGRA